jgi:TRAP-type uncharacterized transport system substrate-binding protein
MASGQENSVANKRPIMSAACKTCIWGPIAELTKEALAPFGYDVQVCYNCNRSLSVPVVAENRETPPLNEWDIRLGDPEPPKGKVDFGVTNSHGLWYAYTGSQGTYRGRPQTQLRLIAYIEDPHFLQVAVKRGSGISDLKDIAAKKMGVTILADRTPLVPPMLDYYGLTREKLESWGGALKEGFYEDDAPNREGDFDIVITAHGGLANNIENDHLYELSQKNDLVFIDLAPDLMKTMAEKFQLEYATLPIGLLKGMDRKMTTLVRNGQSVYTREDVAEDFAYTTAKALDKSRGKFKYLNRPYFYDSNTVWKGIGGVPLHKGAERYYREAGYLK